MEKQLQLDDTVELSLLEMGVDPSCAALIDREKAKDIICERLFPGDERSGMVYFSGHANIDITNRLGGTVLNKPSVGVVSVRDGDDNGLGFFFSR